MHTKIIWACLLLGIAGCQSPAPIAADAIKTVTVTDSVRHDTDDPAIWIHPEDKSKSLIIGTDKDSDGGLYVFNLEGKMVHKITDLKRPNNVDIAYGLLLNGQPVDIAVLTERETHKIRIYSLPDMRAIDNGGIPVFADEQERDPMGIALFTAADSSIYAIVGRKTGPSGSYLWQYKLSDDGKGAVQASLVRKFGAFTGGKEIEAIAVDNELGFVYYSDEGAGIHKYDADPAAGNEELAHFGTADFKEDNEGISIYKTEAGKGYILVSNQQNNSFVVYPREGMHGKPHVHVKIADVPTSTDESDGSEVTNSNLGEKFPEGVFVAMSNGRVFHLYDWRQIQERIDAALIQP